MRVNVRLVSYGKTDLMKNYPTHLGAVGIKVREQPYLLTDSAILLKEEEEEIVLLHLVMLRFLGTLRWASKHPFSSFGLD